MNKLVVQIQLESGIAPGTDNAFVGWSWGSRAVRLWRPLIQSTLCWDRFSFFFPFFPPLTSGVYPFISLATPTQKQEKGDRLVVRVSPQTNFDKACNENS